MINRRSFFGKTVAGIAGFIDFEKFLKSKEPKPGPWYPVPKSTGEFGFNWTCGKTIDELQIGKLFCKPNASMTFSDMVKFWLKELNKTGMCLTWVVPNMFGVPIQLYPIDTISKPSMAPVYSDGNYIYYFYLDKTTKVPLYKISSEHMMKIEYPNLGDTIDPVWMFYSNKIGPTSLDAKLKLISNKVSRYFKKFYGEDFQITIYKKENSSIS